MSPVWQLIGDNVGSVRPPESESLRLIHARTGSVPYSVTPRDALTLDPAPKQHAMTSHSFRYALLLPFLLAVIHIIAIY